MLTPWQAPFPRPLWECLLVWRLCPVATRWYTCGKVEERRANVWLVRVWILSTPVLAFIYLLGPRSFSTPYYHQHQREGRGNERRWNSNESILSLVSSSARKYTRGRRLQLFCGFPCSVLFPSPLLPGNIEWEGWRWSVGWQKKGRGNTHSKSNFFKEKGKGVTQSSPNFIKQAHVWTHLIPSELEEKGCWDHIESNYNTEDARTVIATKRKYSEKIMARTAKAETGKDCMKTLKDNERKAKHSKTFNPAITHTGRMAGEGRECPLLSELM